MAIVACVPARVPVWRGVTGALSRRRRSAHGSQHAGGLSRRSRHHLLRGRLLTDRASADRFPPWGDVAIRERFERARAESDLGDADPDELANYVRTVVYGMAVHAASGATREDLERTIERAMQAWPS